MIENSNIIITMKTMRLQIGLSPEQQNIIIYEKGLVWLEEYFMDNVERIARWERSKLFWNWWIKKWQMETMEVLRCWNFIPGEIFELPDSEKEILRRIYGKAHDSLQVVYPPYLLRQMIDNPRKRELNY